MKRNYSKVKTYSFEMRFLNLFLFFGIIYANKDKDYTNQELTKLVNDLSNKLDQLMKDQNVIGNVDDLQSEIDELKTNLMNQESRIQANEADILENEGDIDTLKVNLTSQDSRIEAIGTKIETNHDSITTNAEDIQVCTLFFENQNRL